MWSKYLLATRQVYITSFTHALLGHSLWTMHRSFIGAYIISILDFPVFHVADLDLALHQLRSQDDFPPFSIKIIVAPEWCSSFDDPPSPMPLRLHSKCHIAAIQSTMGKGLLTIEFASASFEQQTLYSTDQMEFFVHCLQSSMMTIEERAEPKLTCWQLLTNKGLGIKYNRLDILQIWDLKLNTSTACSIIYYRILTSYQ